MKDPGAGTLDTAYLEKLYVNGWGIMAAGAARLCASKTRCRSDVLLSSCALYNCFCSKFCHQLGASAGV